MILELATFANSLAHIITKSERTQGKMVKNGHFSTDATQLIAMSSAVLLCVN